MKNEVLLFLATFCYIICFSTGSEYGTPLQKSQDPLSSRTEHYTYIIDGIQLPGGAVTGFRVYYDTIVGNGASFRLQIYRPEVGQNADLNYKLIGEKRIDQSEVPNNFVGIEQIQLNPSEYIQIKQNDRLGIFNEQDHMSISFLLDASSKYKMRFAITNPPPNVGDTIQFQKIIQPEAFAMAVIIDENFGPVASTYPTTITSTIFITAAIPTTVTPIARPQIVGATGPRGPVGEKGDRGYQGDKGDIGDRGEKGNVGQTGRKGELGQIGKTGDKGDTGQQGSVGVIGVAGKAGFTGQTGPRGFVGDRGDRGSQGPEGEKGNRGDIGPGGQGGVQGVKGDIGPRGDRGYRGHTGPYGPRGDGGTKGTRGEDGPRGYTGITGPYGLTGITGPIGSSFADKDECPTSTCSHGCVNTLGSYYCTCVGGYVLKKPENTTCIDLDECSVFNGGCHHTCTNKPGYYECTCGTGFKIAPDRQTCTDIDECKSNDGGCADDEKCINTPGSKRCIPKVVETVAVLASQSSAQINCESSDGLLSRMTIIGFIVWLIILSLLTIILLICLFVRKGKRKDDFRLRDDMSRRYSEAWDDQRSHKSAPYSSRLPEVNYY